MPNPGESFTSMESNAAKFTSDMSDGRTNASLDYYEEAMNGFFTRLKETLSQAGIDLPLPQLDFFDSGKQNCRQDETSNGGDGGAGKSNPGKPEKGGDQDWESQDETQCDPPAQPPEQPPCNDENGDNDSNDNNGEDSSSRLPFNRKELGGQILLDNFDDVDLDGDGFLRKGEIQDFKRKLDGSLEKASVKKILDDLKHVTRLSNDQRGKEVGASREDLTELVENIQQRGELQGYPSDR